MSNDHSTTAIDTHSDFLAGVNLNLRLSEIVNWIQGQTGFQIDKEIWRSRYYGSEQIGAIYYRGTWLDPPAVLKI